MRRRRLTSQSRPCFCVSGSQSRRSNLEARAPLQVGRESLRGEAQEAQSEDRAGVYFSAESRSSRAASPSASLNRMASVCTTRVLRLRSESVGVKTVPQTRPWRSLQCSQILILIYFFLSNTTDDSLSAPVQNLASTSGSKTKDLVLK